MSLAAYFALTCHTKSISDMMAPRAMRDSMTSSTDAYSMNTDPSRPSPAATHVNDRAAAETTAMATLLEMNVHSAA